MQAIQRPTFLIINPSESAESAALALGVRQDTGAEAGRRATMPRAVAVPDGQVPASGVDAHRATHAADRAMLQTQLPPAGRRLALAASLITTGGISAGTSVGLLTYSIVSNHLSPKRSPPIVGRIPVRPESNAALGQILGTVGTAAIAVGCIATGVALLGGRTANAPADGVAQTELPRRSHQNPQVSVELHEIVVEPNVINAAASGTQQAASRPPTPRWNAAAALAQLPFHEDLD